MTPSGPDGEVFTVLLVCTGNICRSALAERLGRAYLEEVLGRTAGRVRLHSAGTAAVIGSGMHPDSALVLRGFGGDPGEFTARQLTAAMVEESDLVLAMTRGHRRTVLENAPRALARTFTLREAVDLLARTGIADGADRDQPAKAGDLVRALASARARRHGDQADDIPDPINRPIEAHQAAGDLIAEALIPLLAEIASRVRDPESAPADAESPDTNGSVLRSAG